MTNQTLHGIGFTGTKSGLTDAQRDALEDLISKIAMVPNYYRGVHGDCIGADAEFDALCKKYGLTRLALPCDIKEKRAFCDAEEVRAPKKPLKRDDDIVAESHVLLSCPSGKKEKTRSGTWATVRRARKAKRPVIYVHRDGTVVGEDNSDYPHYVKTEVLVDTE